MNFRLFIYPENIQSIEYEVSSRPSIPGMDESFNKFIRLRFTMTQPPSFVVPNNQPLEPKPKSKAVVDSLQSLATVHSFTIYLEMLRLAPEIRHQLSLLPSVFSSTNVSFRLKTDVERANLCNLYKGAGGHVLDFGVTYAEPRAGPSNDIVEQLVQQTIEEVAAPAYTKDGSIRSSEQAITPSDRKRRRTSESPSPSTTDKRILTAFAQLAKRHADLQSRFEHLEKRLADSLGCDHTPCRYDTEEAELINSHVNDKIATEMENVQWELEDNLFGETQQLVVEKAEEQQSQLWADMRQDLMDKMRREIKEELMEELRQELAAEVKKELFKDMAQAMMTAACGDGGTSGTGMSQSTQSTDSTQ